MEIIRLSETQWNGMREIQVRSDQLMIYSGNENEEDKHDKGVRKEIVMCNEGMNALLEWEEHPPVLYGRGLSLGTII